MKNYKELYESSISGSLNLNEMIEPVSSEFQGKEAIRYDGFWVLHFILNHKCQLLVFSSC